MNQFQDVILPENLILSTEKEKVNVFKYIIEFTRI